MRLRVLALPTVTLGDSSATPFLLVFDRSSSADTNTIMEIAAGLKQSTGASGVLVVAEEIELDETQLAEVTADGVDLDAIKRALGAQAVA